MPVIQPKQEQQLKPSAHIVAWSLWGIVTFFYAFQYLLRVSPSVMVGCIMQKFGIEACQFGMFSGAYYIGYTLTHIPLGLMLDRFQVKWVIAISIVVSVVGLLPLALSHEWWLSVIGRFLIGAGSSGAILSVFKVTRMYFPEHWFSRLLGFAVTIGLLGAIYGGTPVDRLSHQFGWENVLLIFFLIGAVIATIVLIWAPRNPIAQDGQNDNMWHELRVVFTNSRVLLTAFFAALMVGPLEGFADAWAIPFLETVYGYDRTVATSLPPVIFLGMCVGSPLLAAVAEKCRAYYGMTVISALGMALMFAVLLFSQPSVPLVGGLFFGIGVLSAYQVLVMYINIKNVNEQYSGLVAAVTNMVIMSFGFVFHLMISSVMNLFWDGQIVNNLAIYQPSSYIYGIAVIPICLMVAFVGFIALRPRSGTCSGQE
jgi:predicted MFS family arabinose efflux permease